MPTTQANFLENDPWAEKVGHL